MKQFTIIKKIDLDNHISKIVGEPFELGGEWDTVLTPNYYIDIQRFKLPGLDILTSLPKYIQTEWDFWTVELHFESEVFNMIVIINNNISKTNFLSRFNRFCFSNGLDWKI